MSPEEQIDKYLHNLRNDSCARFRKAVEMVRRANLKEKIKMAKQMLQSELPEFNVAGEVILKIHAGKMKVREDAYMSREVCEKLGATYYADRHKIHYQPTPLSKAMKEARRKAEFTLVYCAAKAGVSNGTWSKWENAKIAPGKDKYAGIKVVLDEAGILWPE